MKMLFVPFFHFLHYIHCPLVIMNFILFASLLLVVAQAFPLNKRGTGASISVNSSQDFCSYLPPSPGKSVSATERDATPFCTNSTSYADAFPPGFIKSAHFLRTPTYVQVTGKINHTVYDILVEDGGGQYDVKVSYNNYIQFCLTYAIN